MSDNLTFEKVWLMFQETDKKFQETDKKFQETDKKFQETDKKFQEMREEMQAMSKEMDRRFQETTKQFKETDRRFRETDKQFKETEAKLKEISEKTDEKLRQLEKLFTGQWGKLMESLIEGNLVKQLQAKNIMISQTSERVKTKYKKQDYEIDIIAKNGTEVVFVEVKTTLTIPDINRFIHKLNIAKLALPEYSANTIYGAIAFLRYESNAARYAMRKGLYVIRATGNSSCIINPSNFKPVAY